MSENTVQWLLWILHFIVQWASMTDKGPWWRARRGALLAQVARPLIV